MHGFILNLYHHFAVFIQFFFKVHAVYEQLEANLMLVFINIIFGLESAEHTMYEFKIF